MAATDDADAGLLEELSKLRDPSGAVRERARQMLVMQGRKASRSLVQLLDDRDHQTRWEAAKALEEIKDPATAPDLVRALLGKSDAIRWMAAEGLAGIGTASLGPLLSALVRHGDSVRLREGAHHVLTGLARGGVIPGDVTPVISALEAPDPETAVPVAAYNALVALGEPAPPLHRPGGHGKRGA